MKRKILYFLLCPLACVLLLFQLFRSSQEHEKTGFERRIEDRQIRQDRVLQLPNRSFAFAGEPEEAIWLRDYKDPLSLFKINFSLEKVERIKLDIPNSFSTKILNINFDHLDSVVYITNGWRDIAVLGKSVKQVRTNKLLFDEINALSINSMVVRSFKNDGRQQTGMELSKLKLEGDAVITKRFGLPKQLDGVLCADGMLQYHKKGSLLFYIYFHRGQFLCLDTNLAIKYQGKTIDTVTRADIKLGTFDEKIGSGKTVKKITETAPAHLVNRYMSIDQGKLYILSGLKGDNESEELLKRNDPIDVYAISDGHYLYSFYMPKYNGYKLRQFVVKKGVIAGLYRNFLITFRIQN